MRSHVGGHSDGDTRRSVDDQVRKAGGENHRLLQTVVVVRGKIHRILLEIRDNPQKETAVDLTFFRPDGRKDGGAIITVPCTVRRIDEIGRSLILSDRSEIEFENILSIKTIK